MPGLPIHTTKLNTMHHTKHLRALFISVIALCLAATNAVLGQGLTTSDISGTVTDDQGRPLAGATVTIVHEPSGTRAVTTSRPNGQFNAGGLRVGGPYVITAALSGYRSQEKGNVNLDIGSNAGMDFKLGAETIVMAPLKVEADRDTAFGVGKMGTDTTFTASDIENVPSVRKDVQDIANLDSRVAVMSLDQGGQLSVQGQNFRYNSFLIDGVQAVDPFGLNSNGFSSLRSPVPYEAIERFDVELNPYNLRRTGFTGALMNAVIKSGTNEFHGSVSTEYTGQNWRAKNPVTGARDAFHENSYTYTLGGPIIKNRLFFFLALDQFRRAAAPPAINFVPDTAVLQQIVDRAKALGYDAGNLSAVNKSKQDSFIGKLDWNINDDHRLSFTYRRNNGENTSFPSYSYSTTTSLSNYWFQQPRKTDSFQTQLFSQWTPDFRTEVLFSYTKYDGSPSNHGTPFPEVQIQGVSGKRLDNGSIITNGNLYLGTEYSRQYNAINTKEKNGGIYAEYSIGNHTLSFGGESDETSYDNRFLQRYYGAYTFGSVAAWLAGTPPKAYALAQPMPGFTLADANAEWSYNALGAFVQDTYKPMDRLTLTYGLRLDYPYVPDSPIVAPGFQTAFGMANNTTNNGNYTVAPRLGFNYELKTKRKTQIRGGIGLFQGKNPAVWLSNSYSNAGATNSINATTAQLATMTFQPDVTKQPVPSGTTPTPTINVTDPNFVMPAVWKGNLALDHQLPWGGLVASIEVNYLKTAEAIHYSFLNYQLATSGPQTMPDGRDRYNGTITPGTSGTPSTSVNGRRRVSTFADVLYMTDTHKGSGSATTVQLARPMKDNWAFSFSFTHANASETDPVTSSVASSNYQYRASFNPNEEIASTSNTNIKDRVVVTLTRRFHFVKSAPTTVSLVYQGRTGHAYSWVFQGDANGDGYTYNDLLYVPTGPDDPKVSWTSTTERDAFFAWIKTNDLKNYMGTHPSRNSETSPWTQTIDLKLTQQIPLPYGNRVKAEAFASLLNLANLFSKKWGLLDEVPFSYRRGVVGATYNAAGNGGQGQWIYRFNNGTLDTVPTTANDTPVSRWQVQAGIRVKF